MDVITITGNGVIPRNFGCKRNDFNLENYMPQVLSPLPAVGTGTSSNLQLCPSTDKSYYVRFKYKDNLKWTTLISEDYDVIKSTACKCFPDLINSEFEIQDLEGATIDSDFIATFLIISEKGVILNLVPKEDTSCTELFNRRTAENVADKITDSCGSPFSTFSKAYTHGQASCSTETLYSLPSSPSFSSFSTCTNFDEDDTPTIVTPPAKRLKTAVVSYHQITVQELKNYLLSHPGGKELITFYKTNRTLDDPNRKKLVNIVVEHMLQYMPPNLLPSTGTKVEYSKAIVNLFPKLKDRNTPEGYEAFFDPVTKRGFLTTRLRNLFRDKPQRTSSSHSEEQAIIEDEEAFEEKINILKKATEEDLIFKLTEETFTYRNRDRSNVASKYPRFQDTEGLISYEFSLMYPGKENNFVSSFISFLPVIQEVYKITVTSPNQNLLTNDDDDDEDWNEATKCLIIILHLLPPTSSKSARKTSVEKAVNKLVTFQDEQEPLNKIFIQKPSLQPFILGVGPAKSSIKRYYIVFDDKIVPSTKQDIITAFDICFKVHFVFDLNFDRSLVNFYKFIQLKFYDIDVDIVTNRIRELRTKFDNFVKNTN